MRFEIHSARASRAQASSKKLGTPVLVLLTILAVMVLPGSAAAQFNCLPTCDPTDARLLLIANGAGFETLSDPTLDLTFIVPAGTAAFEIGIFDGDIQSGTLPDIHWDTGDPGIVSSIPVFEYTVFADPDGNVSGTQAVAGPFIGSSFLNPANVMPDNDWFDIPITTGPEAQTVTGDYFYRLRIELMNPEDTLAANSFKVRTSEIAVLEPIAQPFGYVAQRSSAADEAIIYPSGFPGPTTYDGNFSFFVESAQAQSTLSVWDGDFDRGDFDGTNSDTDDPNTPGAPFEPIWATGDTEPEAVATGAGVSTGAPPDDNSGDPLTDQFLRQPSVRYDLIAPDSQVYSNENPSGNQEWEEFKISTLAGDPTADEITTSLPAGSYELRIEGVDMSNFNFLLTPSRILCADENGNSCPPVSGQPRFEVGDTVFEDGSGDGVQQGGEPGIQGVIVNLLSADGNVIDTTVTDDNGNYSFTVSPETYTVEVAPENFVAPTAGATLGDRVWLDDGDGLDSGEPGIANVTLHLFLDGGDGLTDGADDTFIAATDTDMNGNYLFTDLAAGTYWVDVVDFTVPAGLSVVTVAGASDPSGLTALAAGGVDLDVDFPYAGSDPATGVVGNYLWIDANGNGLQDAGEAGLGNVTVELIDDVSGITVAETRTGADGTYLFTGVAPGTYVVDVTDTGGILAANGLLPTIIGAGAPDEDSDPDPTAPFAVAAGDLILDKDFGYVNSALADISDVVWFDADRNGLLDGAETGLGGVTVNLLDTQGAVVATTTTAADGSFTFSDLPDGGYSLEITDLGGVLAGLLPTTVGSARGSHTVILAGADVFGESFGWVDTGALEGTAGTTIKDPVGDVNRQVDTVVDADLPTYDFGYRGTGSIGDRVWEDANGDTSQTGEDGINGVTVELLDGDGVVIATQMTSGDGNYLFENLRPGDYTVRVVPPAGFNQTSDIEGPLDNQASLTLGPGENRDDVDFGYQATIGSIGDRVWHDLDGDGVQDAGEAGLNNVTVNLLDSGGSVIATDITAGDGEYLFEDLGPGSYTVEVDASTLPAGFIQTFDIDLPLDNRAGVDLGPGENRSDVDFGYADECLEEINFELGGDGAGLVAGQIIDDEWSNFGVTISTGDPGHPAMIFDSSNPTGGDYDLGTPNEDFSGPGIGSGGGAGQPGANAVPLGNVLIISEDGDSSDPDDNAGGGTITFTFAHPVRVDQVDILDIDEGMAGTVIAFDAGGAMIGVTGMANSLGNNSVQTVNLGISGISRLEVTFPGSGAVSGIVFCADCTPVTVRDDFSSSSFSNNDGPDSWAAGWIENDPEAGGAGPLAGQVQVHDGLLTLDDYPNTGGEPSAAREVDLSGASGATLSFDFLTSSGVDYDDAVTVEVSPDGGITWTTLEVITNISGYHAGWRDFDISAFATSETQVRFRVSNKYGGSNELFCLAFVEITSDCDTCSGVEVLDEFESTSFTNNDGTDDWADGWIENDPESGGAGPWAGQVQVHDGFLTLDDYPNTGGRPSAAREVDLSGAASATLEFDFYTSSGVDYDDAVKVQISSDGGATWTTLEVFTNISGAVSGNRSYDISAFASSETQVRFKVSNKYGGYNEIFCLGFVKISSTCAGGESPEVANRRM